ncbi:MAG TPA: hypothetical protein VHE14_02125 [Solirubrobacteraceae bacterium]|nr:hypothetical protein [Solirubrobacteraceae bacterium]
MSVIALAACWASLPTAPASASPAQLSIMMDDDLMLYRGDAQRADALAKMKSVGVDAVRVTVLWSVLGERTDAKYAAGSRNLDDPKFYPRGNWVRYDNFVRDAYQAGIVPYLDVTGPGPAYAHQRAPSAKDQKTWKPKAKLFGQFVQAVGTRYSGTYRAPGSHGSRLPKVALWSLWNEPNQPGWLEPQFAGGIPVAPTLYRQLFASGRAALETTGHGSDVIMGGETAPIGADSGGKRSPMAPKQFIRELFCLGPDGQPYSGSAASRRHCSDLDSIGQLRMNAWAHHPYTKKRPPTEPDPNPEDITIANIQDVADVLDQAAKGGHLASGLPIVSSEFGYQTNPPNPFAGLSQEDQATRINIGDHLAFNNPRVMGQTQFELRDAPPDRKQRKGSRLYWRTFQSGLFTLGGDAKPSLAAYAMPLDVNPGPPDPASGQGTVKVWGQLRFRPRGIVDQVQMQFRLEGGTAWVNVGAPVAVTNPLGFYEAQEPAPFAGIWRAAWVGADPPYVFVSREAHAGS